MMPKDPREPKSMVSEKFRHQLGQEVQQWQDEGLIDEIQAQALAERYQFAALKNADNNRFILFLMGLGCILLGLAVITFVAANWQVWSKEVKLGLLIALWLGVNIAGFYFARESEDSGRSRLGQGLLLAGTLLLGATFGFIAQMFHLSGASYELFLIWGLGAIAMAWALRLTSLGLCALILLEIGYWGGIIEQSFGHNPSSYLMVFVRHFPLIITFLVIPLAYSCRSYWLFGLATAAGILAFVTNIGVFMSSFLASSPWIAAFLLAIAIGLPPALTWAYQDNLWFFPTNSLPLSSISQKIAIISLSTSIYLFSFHLWHTTPSFKSTVFRAEDWLMLGDLIILGGITLWAWWQLGWRGDRRWGWHIDRTSTAVAGLILLSGFLVWIYFVMGVYPIFITLSFNILLSTLAVGCIRRALGTGKRLGFWGGIFLIVLQLFTRMLEYDTGLLLKATILFLCGVGVITAGLWFERYLKRLHSSLERS